jgi:hypothetical protein
MVVAALLVGATSPIAQGAAPSGAIFTTTADGSVVNENHFSSKCAVYLDGGPGPNAPADAAGLPDGDYYFQVTDPSGKNLLSTDIAANRKFRVEGGVIVAYTGTGGPDHPTGIDQDHLAITIQLANVECSTGVDFLNTPNNGGVYKVWATPVADFEGDPNEVDSECGGGCYHGFVPKKSKTDNFKVTGETPTFCLTVEKSMAPLDGPVVAWPEWPFLIEGVTTMTQGFTDTDGILQVCSLSEGTYKVSEEPTVQYGFEYLTVNGQDFYEWPQGPSYSFTWAPGDPEPVVVFHNVESPPGPQ